MPTPPPTDALHVRCPAKINLALGVGPPDDTGFHPIATWMVALDLADTLTLRRLERDAGQSTYTIRFADDAPASGAIDWPLEQDLSYRAHRALERATGCALPIAAALHKRIPTGAGLGGGSSDAAGMLWGLNELFSLGLSDVALSEHAAALGSDVPFLLAAVRGEPAALATGRGERLEPTPLTMPLDVVLVLPPLACATGAVYAAFDEALPRERHRAQLDERRVRELATLAPVSVEQLDAALFNDLAAPACAVCPELAAVQRRVAAATDRRVHVTGSGAAMFLLAHDADDARRLAQHLHDDTGLPSVATHALR